MILVHGRIPGVVQVKNKNIGVMNTNKKQDWINCIIVFWLVAIPKIICCFVTHPLSIPSDEIATMSAGAYAAGLDWSAVISHAGYYGGGMSIFTAPIYWLTDNPVIIYRAVGIFCAILQSIPASIAYYVVRKYYKVKELSAMLISIACGFFVMAEAHVIFNENPLILVSWIVMLLLYKLHESDDHSRKKCVYTCLLMLTISYAMTLHERSLTYWLALVVVIIFYRLTCSRWLVSFPAMFITGIFGWGGSKLAVKFIQSVLWNAENGAGLRNGSVNLGGGLDALFAMEDIRAWLSIVLGQIHTIGVFTCGFAILLICVFIAIICQFLFSKKLRTCLQSDRIVSISLPVIVFFLSAAAMTIAGQSLSWLGGSIAVYENGYQSQLYGVKAYGYLRYFGIYCGPLLMIGMSWVAKRKELIQKYFKWALGIMVLVEVYWITCIVPYIHYCSEWGVFSYYYPFTWYSPTEPARYMAFMPASMIMFVVFGLSIWFIKNGRKNLCFILVMLSFANAYAYHTFTTDIINADISLAWADDGYRTVKEAEEVAELPKTIYVEDLWNKTDHFNFYMYQFLLNRYQIIPERPSAEVEEAILFSNGGRYDWYYESLFDEGYKCAEIGDYELLFVKGEELQNVFEKAGIELLSE